MPSRASKEQTVESRRTGRSKTRRSGLSSVFSVELTVKYTEPGHNLYTNFVKTRGPAPSAPSASVLRYTPRPHGRVMGNYVSYGTLSSLEPRLDRTVRSSIPICSSSETKSRHNMYSQRPLTVTFAALSLLLVLPVDLRSAFCRRAHSCNQIANRAVEVERVQLV